MRNTLIFFWEIIKIVAIALLIVVPIRYFIFQPFFVKGESMVPNFENGDYLIVDEFSYRVRDPQRGEVIVFKYPNDPSERYIKRIIGLPGETINIKDGNIKITDNSKEIALDESGYLFSLTYTSGDVNISLGQDEYYVLGDNRPASSDSRRWGVLDKKFIIGKVAIKAFPFAAFAKVEAPAY
jgi:signal peptidase I